MSTSNLHNSTYNTNDIYSFSSFQITRIVKNEIKSAINGNIGKIFENNIKQKFWNQKIKVFVIFKNNNFFLGAKKEIEINRLFKDFNYNQIPFDKNEVKILFYKSKYIIYD